jgi:hypothetical protein
MSEDSNSFENLKCVWMQSNIVDYKLCNKNFTCDDCDFYRQITNKSGIRPGSDDAENKESPNLIIRTISKLKKLEPESPGSVILKNHIEIKNLFENIYFFGLSDFAKILIDNYDKIKFVKNGTNIEEGNWFFTIFGEWGKVDFFAPLNLFFLGKTLPEFNGNENNKWLGYIDINKELLSSAVLSHKEFSISVNKVLRYVKNTIKTSGNVGLTIQNGGDDIKFLHQAIGNENFEKLVHEIFSKNV